MGLVSISIAGFLNGWQKGCEFLYFGKHLFNKKIGKYGLFIIVAPKIRK